MSRRSEFYRNQVPYNNIRKTNDLSRDSSVSRKTEDAEGATIKHSQDKKIQVLMPKSSARDEQQEQSASEKLELSDVNKTEPIKYATILARNATAAPKHAYAQPPPPQQQQQQTHKMNIMTNNSVADKFKTKTLLPTTYAVSVPTTSHFIDMPVSSGSTYASGNRGGYLSPVNKNPFKITNLRQPMPSGNNYNNNNNNNNNNIGGYSNRGNNKPQIINMVLQQRMKNNYVVGSGGNGGVGAVAGHFGNQQPTSTTNMAMGNAASTSGQMQGGLNNKKGKKSKRNNCSQKKLKQMEMQNRSRSESLSSTHNNNNNNNNNNNYNTTTITNEKKYTIFGSNNNNATLVKNNNLYDNNNKTSAATFATITKANPYETTTKKITHQTTDSNLSNHSSHLSLATTCSSSSSEVTLTQKNTTTTTTNEAEDLDTKSKQSQIGNNTSLSNVTSPAKSDKQSDYAERTTDTDSETLTADSPEEFIRSNEIIEQYLKPKSSLNYAKELEQENQITFLNNSLSTCEKPDDVNAQTLTNKSEQTFTGQLLFGDFPKEELMKKSQVHKNAPEMKKTKSVPVAPAKEAEKQAVKKKVLKYTLQHLRELEKSPLSRKPPMVDCKNRESISHLFIPRQHHPMAHKHLSTQYQHMNYNESMEFLGKRRGADGNRNMGLKKHHEHTSNANNAGSREASMHQRKLDVIRVQLLLKEEIKLSECANAWQPEYLRRRSPRRASPTVQQQDDLEAVLKKVRGVLNKLTPDNFDVLLKTMSSIIIDTQEKMHQVMLLVFEKTVSEPNFAPTYAKFCKILFQEIKGENRSNFNAALIKRIQHEFETNVNDADAKREKLQPLVDRMESCKDTKERLELQAEIEEREFQFRRRAWGTVRFIGEMYKLQSLTTDRVLLCLESLLQHGCEEKLEYMCKLLTTVGPLLDSTKSENITRLDKIFRRTQEIINRTRNQKNQTKISSRVRFMMQDVIDLRQRNWDQHSKAAKHVQRGSYMDVSPSTSSSNTLEQQRGSYGSQQQHQQQAHGQQQQRGRFQHKQAANMPHHMQHGGGQQQHQQQQQQQQQETNAQKHNIDLTKLRFSAANDNTTLGNKSTYVWNTATMHTNINSNFNQDSPASAVNLAQSSSSASSYHAQRTHHNHKSQSKTRPITSATCGNTTADNKSVKTEFKPKELLNRLVEELLEPNGSWQQEASQQWHNINREEQISLIRYLLCDYLHLSEVKRANRQACSQIFVHLMRDSAKFEHSIFTEAYAQFGMDFPDLIVDVPNGWAYVFDFVGPIWQASLLDFTDIWLKTWLNEEQFTERFVKAMFDYYLAEFGKNYTRSIWQKLFAGGQAVAQGYMAHIERWLEYGQQQIDRLCTNIAGTTLSEQQQQQQRRSIEEQLKRIEYLLNISENSDLAEDYIATNVHITNNFLRNLTKFVCCEYAVTTQMTDKKNATTTTTTTSDDKQLLNNNKYLDEPLFKQKCVPLLRTCLRGYEIKDFGMLDTIVHSLATMHDKQTANELVRQIFNALHECNMISKDAYDNWQQATDTEQSMDEDESCSASSLCDSLTDDLEATLTSANVEFITSAAAKQQAHGMDNIGAKATTTTTTMSTQSRGRKHRNRHTRPNVNKSQHGEVSRSASTSTANSPVHTPTPPTRDNTSKSYKKSTGVKNFMERLI